MSLKLGPPDDSPSANKAGSLTHIITGNPEVEMFYALLKEQNDLMTQLISQLQRNRNGNGNGNGKRDAENGYRKEWNCRCEDNFSDALIMGANVNCIDNDQRHDKLPTAATSQSELDTQIMDPLIYVTDDEYDDPLINLDTAMPIPNTDNIPSLDCGIQSSSEMNMNNNISKDATAQSDPLNIPDVSQSQSSDLQPQPQSQPPILPSNIPKRTVKAAIAQQKLRRTLRTDIGVRFNQESLRLQQQYDAANRGIHNVNMIVTNGVFFRRIIIYIYS